MSMKPKVLFHEYAFEAMYARGKAAAPNEVGGLGLVDVLEDGTLYVAETFLVKQRVGPASTTLDQPDMARWMLQNRDKVERVRLWWHSHVNFQTFLSGTDENAIKELLKIMPWVITPVVNCRNDLHLSLHVRDPFQHRFEELEYDVISVAELARQDAEAEVPEAIIQDAEVRKDEFSKGIVLAKDNRVAQPVATETAESIRDRLWSDWELGDHGSFQGGYPHD